MMRGLFLFFLLGSSLVSMVALVREREGKTLLGWLITGWKCAFAETNNMKGRFHGP